MIGANKHQYTEKETILPLFSPTNAAVKPQNYNFILHSLLHEITMTLNICVTKPFNPRSIWVGAKWTRQSLDAKIKLTEICLK